ncbi:S8/S53 family peptidase [Spongiactinospora sp. TRM90649]|uniref:S8 family peptidase n=1 Tax=Spongiactinospora sp. TRM90649 TaxID=3031114 RepID=UPI0023F7C778|nr:S8/S53 family peptidase [Spongiactinospora sp. TRM90649]MDF5758338.1 S8/S53 family peptidase [Spongiactinospora sp. TRM90649]
MGLARGRVEIYEKDQLVVVLPHLGVVLRQLDRIGAGVTDLDIERNSLLRLARITIPNLSGAVAALLEADPNLERDLIEQRGEGNVHEIDIILRGLRLRFRREYDDWTPVMGKNRGVEEVRGEPYISGGLEGDPAPAVAIESLGAAHEGEGEGVRVGVLDTRVYPHPLFQDKYVTAVARDMLPAAPGTEGWAYTEGHATMIVGRILMRAPAAEVSVQAVLDENAQGDAWSVAKAMASVARGRPHVLNLSIGGQQTDDGLEPLIFRAALGVVSDETVVVVAAGNHGNVSKVRADHPDMVPEGLHDNSASWPAAMPQVLAVGACAAGGEIAPFTPKVPWIGVLAPGVDLEGPYLRGEVVIRHRNGRGEQVGTPRYVGFGGSVRWSGTSFAAAVVSGEIAARTIPGRISSREALELARQDPASLITGYSESQAL